MFWSQHWISLFYQLNNENINFILKTVMTLFEYIGSHIITITINLIGFIWNTTKNVNISLMGHNFIISSDQQIGMSCLNPKNATILKIENMDITFILDQTKLFRVTLWIENDHLGMESQLKLRLQSVLSYWILFSNSISISCNPKA